MVDVYCICAIIVIVREHKHTQKDQKMTISRMFGTVRPITNVKMHGPAGVTFESPAYGDLGVAAGAGFMHMRGYATDVECCTTILEEEGFTPTLAGGIVGMGTLTPKMRKMVDEAMSSAVL